MAIFSFVGSELTLVATFALIAHSSYNRTSKRKITYLGNDFSRIYYNNL